MSDNQNTDENFLEDIDEDTEEAEEGEIIIEENDEKILDDASTPPVPQAGDSLLQPVSDIDDVVDLYEEFEAIKEKLLDDPDKTEISGNIHVNKSGWRKIATAFNVSVETIDEERYIENGIVKYKVKARATAPNGKVATGVAIAASNESNHMEKLTTNRDDKPNVPGTDSEDILWIDGAYRRLLPPKEVNDHNLYATAATRAKNRAISDCVGGGEVSAEEIKAEDVL